mgnify:CR=1 FL=1
MFANKQKENQANFYHRISLPKQINPSNKSISTRCISVNKPETKIVPLVSPNMNKTNVPAKQLTVHRLLF